MKLIRQRRLWLPSLLLAALTLAACGGAAEETGSAADGASAATSEAAGDGAAGENDMVSLRYSWTPDDLYLPVVMAKEQGYYDEEGITVVDQTGNGGATAATLVASGDVMVGQGEASHVINARSQGLPIVSILQQLQEQPSGVIALKESGIEDWSDLVGKKVGGTAASSSSLAFDVSLSLQGIDPSEVEFVNLSAGANFAALQEGEVDAAMTFLGNIASLPYKDDLNILPFGDAGFDSPSTGFFVTEDWLAENRNLGLRFVRATLRGLADTITDPAGASEALANQQALIDTADIEARWNLNAQFVETEVVEEHGLGYHEPEQWQFLADVLVEQGELTEEIDPTTAYTNELVEEAAIDAP